MFGELSKCVESVTVKLCTKGAILCSLFHKNEGEGIKNIAPNLKDQNHFKKKFLGEQMAL